MKCWNWFDYSMRINFHSIVNCLCLCVSLDRLVLPIWHEKNNYYFRMIIQWIDTQKKHGSTWTLSCASMFTVSAHFALIVMYNRARLTCFPYQKLFRSFINNRRVYLWLFLSFLSFIQYFDHFLVWHTNYFISIV